MKKITSVFAIGRFWAMGRHSNMGFLAVPMAILVMSVLFCSNVNAQSYTIDASTWGTTKLSGVNAGNNQSFDVDLNLSTLPKNLVINTAMLKFTTSGSAAAGGDVRLLDKYKSSSTNLIDIISLDTAGQKQTANILTNVKEWYANSLFNYGVSFASKDFTDNDSITFSSIQLLIDASNKDTTAPVITKEEVVKTDLDAYKFMIETDEATKVVVNIGKTSIYDQKASSEAAFLTSHEISFSNLQNGVTYHYQIVAIDSSGNETKTDDAVFLTNVLFQTQTGSYVQDDSLLPPNNLGQDLAKKGEKYSVVLSWTPSISEDIDGYIVFRKSSDSNNYVELVKLSPTAFSYQDESIEAGKTYDYLINSYMADRISFEGAKVQVEVPVDSTADTTSQPATTYNTGQVLLILFAVAVMVYITAYLVIKFLPKILNRKSGKDPLKNILKDPTLYENTVTSEFGSNTETDYPKDEPTAGRDMN